jgi:hypothetical protein
MINYFPLLLLTLYLEITHIHLISVHCKIKGNLSEKE